MHFSSHPSLILFSPQLPPLLLRSQESHHTHRPGLHSLPRLSQPLHSAPPRSSPSPASSFAVLPPPPKQSTVRPWYLFSGGAWRGPMPSFPHPRPPSWTPTSCRLPQATTLQVPARFWRLSRCPQLLSSARPLLPATTGARPLPLPERLPPPSGLHSISRCSSPPCESLTIPRPFVPTEPSFSALSSFSESPRSPPWSPKISTAVPSASMQQNGAPLSPGAVVLHSSPPGSVPSALATVPNKLCSTFPQPPHCCGPLALPSSHGTLCGEPVLSPSSALAPIPPTSSFGDVGALSAEYVPISRNVDTRPCQPCPASSAPVETARNSDYKNCGLCPSSDPVHLPWLPAVPMHRHNRAEAVLNSCLRHVEGFAPHLNLRSLFLELLPHLSGPVPQEDYLYDAVAARRPATPASIAAGLGARGNATIPEFIWLELNLPLSLPSLPVHPPRCSSLDSLMFLHTLTRDEYIFPVPSQPGIPIFTLYKTRTQARLIADARAFNTLWHKPSSFSLPNFAALLPALAKATHYFVKLDVKNFYWSLKLPSSVSGLFIYTYSSHTGLVRSFGGRSLPFGWSWSPVLAQRSILHFLGPLLPLLSTVWVFYDDILLAHPDPHFLTFLTHFACPLLSSNGLLLSQKSVLVPTTAVVWLGKMISSSGIRNTTTRSACVLRSIINLFTLRCSWRGLQRVLGSMQWLASPFSCVGAWLAPV